jgi:hypothetical protein
VALACAQNACTRDPLDEVCPAVAPGELVVTEVRGSQSGSDGYGQWIEIYNASSGEVDLRGLEIFVRRVDGGADGHILVRTSVLVAAGDYAVIGRFLPDQLPDYVDYGYQLDCEDTSSGCDSYWFDTSLYDAAAIDLLACDELIDRAIYRDLPSRGTWAFDGDDPPDADANDVERDWCVDDQEDDNTEQLGIRGTPGEANPSC